jgi:uncharacterized membrane protein YkvA (DUF1232 family)
LSGSDWVVFVIRLNPKAGGASRIHFMAFERSKEITRSLKREVIVYQRVLRDERTPVVAKLFLGLAIGYLLMPFDLIPDFIPVIGHLDDAVVIPALVFVALRFIPREIIAEHREQITREGQTTLSRAAQGQAIRETGATRR